MSTFEIKKPTQNKINPLVPGVNKKITYLHKPAANRIADGLKSYIFFEKS